MIFTPLEGRVILTDFKQPESSKVPKESPKILGELADIWRNLDGTPRFRVVYGECAVKTRGGKQILAYRKKNPFTIQTGWAQGNNRYPMTVDQALLPAHLPVYPIMREVWEGLKCWVLEEWEGPESLAKEWFPRYIMDRDGNKVDWMGAMPRTGCYRAVAFIHDGSYGYVPIPESLPAIVRGLLEEAQKQAIENPYLENTPELIQARKDAINAELNKKEEDNINALTAEFVEEITKNQLFREDLETALNSEVDYHLKRQEMRTNATR